MKLDIYQNVCLDNHKIYTFKQPLKVSKGEVLKIKATLLLDNVWFELFE